MQLRLRRGKTFKAAAFVRLKLRFKVPKEALKRRPGDSDYRHSHEAVVEIEDKGLIQLLKIIEMQRVEWGPRFGICWVENDFAGFSGRGSIHKMINYRYVQTWEAHKLVLPINIFSRFVLMIDEGRLEDRFVFHDICAVGVTHTKTYSQQANDEIRFASQRTFLRANLTLKILKKVSGCRYCSKTNLLHIISIWL